jgi:hypothetical protein
MQKLSVTHRIFLAVFILLLTGCGGSGKPDVQVNELSNNTTSYDETVHINNCGGKADSEQTKSHSFSTSIEGGIDVGIQQVVEGVISAKYSQFRNVSVSQRLVAPAGTNMEFVLRWSEEVRAGNVTVNGSTGTYKANIPVAVEQVSSQDLGNCGTTQNQLPSNSPTIPQPSGNNGCSAYVTRAQVNELKNIQGVSEALSQAQVFSGYLQIDFRPGDKIPAGALIATDFLTTDIGQYNVIRINSQGGWGLFETTTEIQAPTPGTYRCIQE